MLIVVSRLVQCAALSVVVCRLRCWWLFVVGSYCFMLFGVLCLLCFACSVFRVRCCVFCVVLCNCCIVCLWFVDVRCALFVVGGLPFVAFCDGSLLVVCWLLMVSGWC